MIEEELPARVDGEVRPEQRSRRVGARGSGKNLGQAACLSWANRAG